MTSKSSHQAHEFRVVQYVLNPTAGVRVPVAVLVRDKAGETVSIVAPNVPSAVCLGSSGAYAHIKAFAPHLSRLSSFDQLPEFLGPYFVMTEPKRIPSATAWRSWINRVVFPRFEGGTTLLKKGPRLPKLGRQFFSRHGVNKLVEDRYVLPTEAGEMLEPITHWVSAESFMLLMEPLSPNRKDPRKDMRAVSTRLTAYRQRLGEDSPQTLLAYSLHGLDRAIKHDLMVAVDGVAEVYDIEDPDQETELIRMIRQAAPPALVEA